MKLCVLDHAPKGTLAQAWTRLPPLGRPAQITVFPVTAEAARAPRMDDGRLTLGSGEDAVQVPLTAFDAFALNGLTLGPALLIDWLQTHGIAGEMNDRPQIVSYDMFWQAWDAQLTASPLPELLSCLRQSSDAPILLLPEPMPPESLLQDTTARARFCAQLCDTGDGSYLRDLAERLIAPHLQGATYLLGQPVETTVQMVLTRQDYTDAPETYGTIVLEQVLDALGVAPQPRSTITEPTE